MSAFHIRDLALPEDAEFILEAFDANLPHLASIGSGSQWGSEPRSTNERHVNHIQTAVEKARSGTSDNDAVFIAELPVGDNGPDPVAGRTRTDNKSNQQMLQVGAAVLQGFFPEYVLKQENLEARVQAAIARADFLYLFVLVSDFRVGALRKGAGAALAQRVKQYALEKGKAAVYLDCWSGNGDKLVGFYKSQGYVLVDDFQATKEDGFVWHGKLLRLDVDGSSSEE